MNCTIKLLALGSLLFASALADPPPPAPPATTPTRAELNAKANTTGDNADASPWRTALDVFPARDILLGTPAPFRAARSGIERFEDKSFLFVGDSTFYDTVNGGLPKAFADRLATDATSHRVEFRINTSDASGSTLSLLRAGGTRRHWNFSAGDQFGLVLPQTEFSQSPSGADFAMEFEFSFDAFALSSGLPPSNTIFAGWHGNSNGYMRFMFVSGVLAFYWSEDASGSTTKVASVAMPTLTAGTIYRWRVELDIDNGTSGRTISFKNWNGSSFVQMSGSPVVQNTGVSTIHMPANAVMNVNTAGGAPTAGMRVYEIQIFKGATGIPLLPWRIDQWMPPNGIGTDVAPTLEGTPVLYIDCVAQNGATLRPGGFFTGSDADDMTPNLYRCLRDHRPEVLFISSSHNDDNLPNVQWATQMDAAVTNLLNFLPFDPAVVHLTQNPEPTSYSYGLYSGIHNRRQSFIPAYAASRGRASVDLYGWMLAGYNAAHYTPGNVHLTGPGYAYQFQGFWDCYLEGTNRTN